MRPTPNEVLKRFFFHYNPERHKWTKELRDALVIQLVTRNATMSAGTSDDNYVNVREGDSFYNCATLISVTTDLAALLTLTHLNQDDEVLNGTMHGAIKVVIGAANTPQTFEPFAVSFIVPNPGDIIKTNFALGIGTNKASATYLVWQEPRV